MNKKLLILLSLLVITTLMNSCFKDKFDLSKLNDKDITRLLFNHPSLAPYFNKK